MTSKSAYTVGKYPFLLTKEYFSIAWVSRYAGIYIDPMGNVLEHNLSENWNYYSHSEKKSSLFWRDEMDAEIKPNLLFENLKQTTLIDALEQPIDLDIHEVYRDLIESRHEEIGSGCDLGILSYCILIYDAALDTYKRIVLYTYGDLDLWNTSKYTGLLLDYFPKK